MDDRGRRSQSLKGQIRMADFKVVRYKVRTGETHHGPNRPFSAVFLSDLHNVSYGEKNCRLLSEIRNEKPEVVFVGGDMLTAEAEPQMEAAVELMDELTRKYPVFYGNGNHEHRMKINPARYGDHYEQYTERIRSLGVNLLENTGKTIEVCGLKLRIWGYELPAEYFRRRSRRTLESSQIEETLGKPEEKLFHVLLAHHPAFFEAYAGWGADLTLSGHLHGGIVRLPFLGGVISPQMRIFPKYDRGLYKLDDKKLIVSAGLGSHTIPIRINNPAELVVIDFV